MNVLGISAHFHDASAALMRDDALVAAGAEERFTLQKHDASYPRHAIDFCLRRGSIAAGDLDAVVFYEEPHLKFSRVLASSFGRFPFSRDGFVRSMKAWVGNRASIKNEISKRLDIHPRLIHFGGHHESHAAQAFGGSGFSSAAILVVDAVGEWDCTSIYSGKRHEDGRFELRHRESVPFPHSLGLLYSAFTAFLGFRVNDGECSVMALAAFGEPKHADRIRKVVEIQGDGSYRLVEDYFDFESFHSTPFTSEFLKLFGEPRNPSTALPFDCLSDAPSAATPEQQYFADLAASLQQVLEEALLALARRAKKLTSEERLCFAGGVALNCVANEKLAASAIFREIHIPPDPGDGGAAIGCAAGFTKRGFVDSPYLGNSYSEELTLGYLSLLETRRWPGADRGPLDVRSRLTLDTLVSEATRDLAGGKIVAWVQGRFEAGPRALGNRSLLIHPGRIDVARRLSAEVKGRAPYRPYALATAFESAEDLLGRRPGRNLWAPSYRWMQRAPSVQEEWVEKTRAGLHIDRTTRIQVCTQEENPRFHALLRAFQAATGIPALINTSLNGAGFPMCASPEEALLLFARTSIDTLVLNDSIVRKDRR